MEDDKIDRSLMITFNTFPIRVFLFFCGLSLRFMPLWFTEFLIDRMLPWAVRRCEKSMKIVPRGAPAHSEDVPKK